MNFDEKLLKKHVIELIHAKRLRFKGKKNIFKQDLKFILSCDAPLKSIVILWKHQFKYNRKDSRFKSKIKY